MSIQNRNTDTLTGDLWLFCFYDHTILNVSPDTKRFLLGFFFLTTDIRDNISNHFRPVFESLSCSGDCLVSSSYDLIRFELFPCSQDRCITLDRAVRFYCDKSSGGSQTFFLMFDDFKVLWIDFRHYHRHIRGPAMCTVIGNNRCLSLCISLLDCFDLILGHIHCTEYKINACSYFFYFIDIHNNDLLYRFRHRSIHLPASSDSFLISLSCGTCTGCNGHYLKPRVILKQ